MSIAAKDVCHFTLEYGAIIHQLQAGRVAYGLDHCDAGPYGVCFNFDLSQLRIFLVEMTREWCTVQEPRVIHCEDALNIKRFSTRYCITEQFTAGGLSDAYDFARQITAGGSADGHECVFNFLNRSMPDGLKHPVDLQYAGAMGTALHDRRKLRAWSGPLDYEDKEL